MLTYPSPNYHFAVEFAGEPVRVSEIFGLEILFELIQYRDGALKDDGNQKMPGLNKNVTVTLKRGITKGDNHFSAWIQSKRITGIIDRKTVTINLLNEDHNPIITWKLKNAFPIRYSGPALNAKGTDVAMEELELVHEGLEFEDRT